MYPQVTDFVRQETIVGTATGITPVEDNLENGCTLAPTRVCFLIDMMRLGGTEMHVLKLIRGLDRSKVIPYLCLLDGSSEESRRLEPDDCDVHRLGVKRLLRFSTLGKLYEFQWQLRAWKIDVLQVHFPDSTYFGVAGGVLAGVKSIVRTRRDLFYWVTPTHRRFGRLLDNFYNRTFVDVLLVNSRAVAAAARASERAVPKRIVIIENGIDLSRFVALAPLPGSPPRRPIRVGMVAMLRPEKRVDLLVEAAHRLASVGIELEFEVAGEGSCRAELSRRISELGLAGRFALSGATSDIPSFVERVDICVLCSDTEGQSNALVEYMAAGRAVVATNVGGNCDIVKDNESGLLIPPGSPADLAAAIEKLAQSHSLRARLGNNARACATARFSQADMLRKHEEFYRCIAAASLSRC